MVLEVQDGKVSVIRCKNCKHYAKDHYDIVGGIQKITAHDICNFWCGGCKTEPDGWCFRAEPIEGSVNLKNAETDKQKDAG